MSVNGGYGSVTELSSTGQLISGPTGFTAGGIAYPIAIAIDTNSTVWVTGQPQRKRHSALQHRSAVVRARQDTSGLN